MVTANNILLIEELIAKDQLIEAIEMLISIARESSLPIKSDFILFSRDLYNLKRGVISGRISFDEEYNERRKISFRMLQLLDNIKDYRVAV